MAVDIFYISSIFCTKKEQRKKESGVSNTQPKEKKKNLLFLDQSFYGENNWTFKYLMWQNWESNICISFFFFFAYKYPIIKVRRHQAHLQKEKIEGWKFYSKNRFNISILLYLEESVEIIACMVPFKSSPQTTKWSWAYGTMFPLSSCWDSKQSTLQMQISTRKVYKWSYHSSMVMIW